MMLWLAIRKLLASFSSPFPQLNWTMQFLPKNEVYNFLYKFKKSFSVDGLIWRHNWNPTTVLKNT